MMRSDDDPGADPEAAGLPEYADDESPGNRAVGDPQRQPVPGDHPVALDDYGLTAAEQRHGEPLAAKLVREEPDTVDPDVRLPAPEPETPSPGEPTQRPTGGLSAEEAAMHEEDGPTG